MRLFGGERMTTVFAALGVEEDMEIEHAMLSKAIESAQKKVESRNFGIRKHVLEYDDVMNKQREMIYKQRRQVLEGEDLHGYYQKMVSHVVTETMLDFCGDLPNSADWDTAAMTAKLQDLCGDLPALAKLKQAAQGRLDAESLTEEIVADALVRFESRVDDIGSDELMREAERVILLRTVDSHWMDHIDQMDDLRDSIGMRGYAQHDPVIEYKKEGFTLYDAMTRAIQEDAVRLMMRARFNVDNIMQRQAVAKNLAEGHGGTGYAGDQEAAGSGALPAQAVHSANSRSGPVAGGPPKQPQRRDETKVGRNDPCPCGSGKKYKNCHGQLDN
jgi:preprotein translocase subunit SecA